MKHHSELINLIASKIGAKTYVEIGVFNPDHNFNLIQVEKKFGVDPAESARANCRMSSDDFFDFMIAAGAKVDLSWIDGLHHSDQFARDIQKAWAITRPGGIVAAHDCNPHSESITHVPRDSREWCGDVYKAASNINLPSKMCVDFDYGCLILKKEYADQDLIILDRQISWDDFDRMREYYLHLVPLDRALEIIDLWEDPVDTTASLMQKYYDEWVKKDPPYQVQIPDEIVKKFEFPDMQNVGRSGIAGNTGTGKIPGTPEPGEWVDPKDIQSTH